MSFTVDDMRREYAIYGNSLRWADIDGELYSANPADYWSLPADERFDGELLVVVPATYRALGYAAEPRRSRA